MKTSEPEDKNDFGYFEIEVIPNYEIKSILLSFGSQIEIVSPIDYRDLISEEINLLSDRYKK